MIALVGIGQLAFVDDNASIRVAFVDGVKDRVEWPNDRVELWKEDAREKRRCRDLTGNGDALAFELVDRKRFFRDDDRAVALAHARARRHDPIFVGDGEKGMRRNGRDLEIAVHRSLVERLDVLEHMVNFEIENFDGAVRERAKHERVIGVRAMPDLQNV